MTGKRQKGCRAVQRWGGLFAMVTCAAAGLWLLGSEPSWAQPGRPAGARPGAGFPGAAPSPSPQGKTGAPFDPSGYWVSLVTRDWRFRMVVPGPGEYQGIAINAASKNYADAWNAAADEAAGKQCEAYGAAALMLVPERLHISWQAEKTLKVETDAGMQTRLMNFQPSPTPVAASLQGYSLAEWQMHQSSQVGPPGAGGAEGTSPYGALKIVTTNLQGGLLRKNGVPYSDQAILTEYWELHEDPIDKTTYLIDTAGLHDPKYLMADYYYTATFEREADGAKWHPTPCSLTSAP